MAASAMAGVRAAWARCNLPDDGSQSGAVETYEFPGPGRTLDRERAVLFGRRDSGLFTIVTGWGDTEDGKNPATDL